VSAPSVADTDWQSPASTRGAAGRAILRGHHLRFQDANKEAILDKHIHNVPFYREKGVKKYHAHEVTVRMAIKVRDCKAGILIYSHKWNYTWRNFDPKTKTPTGPSKDLDYVGIYDAKGVIVPARLQGKIQ
jgi:hypothetical protein